VTILIDTRTFYKLHVPPIMRKKI